MRLLCFSDLHRDQDAARSLVERSADVELVIGAGDFANRHQGIADTIEILAAIDKPTILVPGNGETFTELRDAAANWPAATVLHGSGCERLGLSFWGVGGGIPVTPFGAWSYDFDEQQADQLLAECPANGILVVHSPPIDTVDRDRSGRVRGSQAIRDCVVAKQPQLVVCGHIHDDWGQQASIANSRIVNAGPGGVIIEID